MLKSIPTPKVPSLLASPSTVETPPEQETIQGNLKEGRAVAGNPDLAEAQAWLRDALPLADAGLAVHEAWRKSPVVPKPDVEDFPPHETVDALLAVANLQVVSDADLPATMADEFMKARNNVNGFLVAMDHAKAAKDAIATLRAEDCQRPEHFRQFRLGNRWPNGGTVSRLRATLDAMRLGRDILDARTHALAVTLEQLLRVSRNRKAAGIRKATLTMSPRRDETPREPDVHFSPFDYPTR